MMKKLTSLLGKLVERMFTHRFLVNHRQMEGNYRRSSTLHQEHPGLPIWCEKCREEFDKRAGMSLKYDVYDVRPTMLGLVVAFIILLGLLGSFYFSFSIARVEEGAAIGFFIT